MTSTLVICALLAVEPLPPLAPLPVRREARGARPAAADGRSERQQTGQDAGHHGSSLALESGRTKRRILRRLLVGRGRSGCYYGGLDAGASGAPRVGRRQPPS